MSMNGHRSTQVSAREGFVPFRGFKTWYRVLGDREEPGRLPLLVLHGGPGAVHDYLEPLGTLMGTRRRVVLYDQLGNGKSDHPHDTSMWTVDLFLAELVAVLENLCLDRVHILGHSWGGMLAMEYALTQPRGLASIIVSDSPASIPQWLSEASRLRAELPKEVQETLRRHEEDGTMEDPEYEQAMMVFYRQYVCRMDEPWPDCVQRTFQKMTDNPEVYHTMNGPNEFHVIGTLKDWDITSRLGEIHVPTLVVGGRYDEATPAITETVHRGISDSEWVIFEKSAHFPHLEEPELYVKVVERFLSRVEAAA